MRVGLADDADAGPSRVTEDDDLGLVVGQGLAQQRVARDLRPQLARVVAEPADLGRGLVDEAELPVRCAHRHGAEERIRRPVADDVRDRRRREVETVVAHEQVQAGRVAAADLEALRATPALGEFIRT